VTLAFLWGSAIVAVILCVAKIKRGWEDVLGFLCIKTEAQKIYAVTFAVTHKLKNIEILKNRCL
ncbi:MAG: hypothetical protein WAV82_00180, partial [Methylobacter sp.]